MFRSKTTKAANHAIRVVQPMILLTDRHTGMSKRIWDDPYFLGFVGGFVSIATIELYKLTSAQADQASVMAINEISGLDGDYIFRRFTDLLEEKHGDTEWGFDNAVMIYAYQTDRLKSDFDDAQLFDLIEECDGDKQAVVLRLMKERFFAHVEKFMAYQTRPTP